MHQNVLPLYHGKHPKSVFAHDNQIMPTFRGQKCIKIWLCSYVNSSCFGTIRRQIQLTSQMVSLPYGYNIIAFPTKKSYNFKNKDVFFFQ